MKKIVALSVLCISALPAFAHDAEHAATDLENYIGISASKLTSGASSTGAAVTLGHRYGEYFAAEIAYEDTGAINATGERTTAYSAAGVGYLPLVEGLEAFGRFGYATANTKDASGIKANHGGMTYGAGFEHKLNEKYSVALGWDRLHVGDNVAIPRANEDSYALTVFRKF
jgi:opacity protein-like surface antigen